MSKNWKIHKNPEKKREPNNFLDDRYGVQLWQEALHTFYPVYLQ